MMAVDNPILSLKNLNDLESKFMNNNDSVQDYEELDFFISSIGGNQNFIKSAVIQNGFHDFYQYISEKKINGEGKKIQIGKIHGTVLGALSFLKSYAIQNKFYI